MFRKIKNKKQKQLVNNQKENEMEQIIQAEVINKEKNFKTFKIIIMKLLVYFIIYSVLGFIIETIFAVLTKGVLESRKSFLYGPFCSIYGISAIIMIIVLEKFKKNNYILFFAGFFIGSIIEYIFSWFGEIIFHIRWWDYSHIPFNINGRICVWFSLFWGVLAIYLITHFHPKVIKFLKKINLKVLKIITTILIIFIFIDFCITGFALKMFFTRLVSEHDLQLKQVNIYLDKYIKIYQEPIIKKIVDTFFNDQIILKTFPNIKVISKDGELIWVYSILTNITPYYLKIFTPKFSMEK